MIYFVSGYLVFLGVLFLYLFKISKDLGVISVKLGELESRVMNDH